MVFQSAIVRHMETSYNTTLHRKGNYMKLRTFLSITLITVFFSQTLSFAQDACEKPINDPAAANLAKIKIKIKFVNSIIMQTLFCDDGLCAIPGKPHRAGYTIFNKGKQLPQNEQPRLENIDSGACEIEYDFNKSFSELSSILTTCRENRQSCDISHLDQAIPIDETFEFRQIRSFKIPRGKTIYLTDPTKADLIKYEVSKRDSAEDTTYVPQIGAGFSSLRCFFNNRFDENDNFIRKEIVTAKDILDVFPENSIQITELDTTSPGCAE
jgi:hypothetical protein